MKNNLTSLNNYLFEAIERIIDDDLDEEELMKEIRRSEAVVKIADTVLKNAEVQLKALEYMDEYGQESSRHTIPLMLGAG